MNRSKPSLGGWMVPAAEESSGATGSSIRRVLRSHWQDGLLCAGAVAVCFLIARPSAEVPLSDDFSYAKSALDFAQTGHLHYNGWAATSVGWLAMWGALFIQVFGFSFTLLRWAMLPLAMATVLLFHQVLVGFGIGRRSAALGALTLGVSPLFLQLTASFLTDVPGLLPVVGCLYLCQRAAASSGGRRAVFWLVCAAVVSLVGGTVRQTTWLGALVMVPATALLLRRRRGMAATGVVLLAASLVCVVWVMHWCNRQPYFFVVSLIPGGARHKLTPANLLSQTARTTATLMLLTLPVVAAWLVRWRGVRAGVRLALVLCAAVAASVWLAYRGELDAWLLPWLSFNLVSLGAGGLPVWIRWVLSVVCIAAAVEWVLQMCAFSRTLWAAAAKHGQIHGQTHGQISEMERRAVWMLGPFSAAYALFLVPRGIYGVFDRYLMALVLGVVVSLLLLYQRSEESAGETGPDVPWECWALLAAFAVFGTASVHDAFCGERARVLALHRLEAAGVAPTAISAGLGQDGWEQVVHSGHVNVPEIKVPAGTFRVAPGWGEPPGCTVQYAFAMPEIRPDYILQTAPSGCFAPSEFAPEPYNTWLPPFGRAIFIDRIHAGSR